MCDLSGSSSNGTGQGLPKSPMWVRFPLGSACSCIATPQCVLFGPLSVFLAYTLNPKVARSFLQLLFHSWKGSTGMGSVLLLRRGAIGLPALEG